MAVTKQIQKEEKLILKAKSHCLQQPDINILLLGRAGVGKTTFINAFANYIAYDTLQDAEQGELQVVIRSCFRFTDPNTCEATEIVINKDKDHGQFNDIEQLNTYQCQSFVFPIGERKLRFINAPGIGYMHDTEQDQKTFQEIMDYISQYEHLNAVLIFLKPDEERLNVAFRYCINELLRHSHISIKESIVFIYTNARATFFRPGRSHMLICRLFDEHREKNNVDVPYTRDNTFLFDNESFRYLAILKHGIQMDHELTQCYSQTWEHSVREYARMMKYIVTRPLHAVKDALSLNTVEQLVRILPHPLAEIMKLIEENIQYVQQFQKEVLQTHSSASNESLQNTATFIQLEHPQTVCFGEECSRMINVNGETKTEFLVVCHDKCYCTDTLETIFDPKLRNCRVMNSVTEVCRTCYCSWKLHQRITCAYHAHRDYSKTTINSSVDYQDSAAHTIYKRIDDLREESKQIQNIYRTLAQFLYKNSLLPINDDYVNYIQFLIYTERKKTSEGVQNTEIILNLEKAIIHYKIGMELFQKTINEQREAGETMKNLEPEEVNILIEKLYRLPMNGKQIRAQVHETKIQQTSNANKRDVFIPVKAAPSIIICLLKEIMK